MTRIVCVHGLRRTPDDWEAVRARLPTAWGSAAVAVPGDPDLALDALDVAVRAGDVVFAHSMGAVTMRRLVVERPRPLTAVVMTGSFFPPARNGRTTSTTILDYVRHRAALLGEMRRMPPGPRSERSRRALGTLLGDARGRTTTAWDPQLAALVVHGRNDHHVPVDFAVAACADQPSWELRILEGAHHHVHAEQPSAWLDVVMPWLCAVITAGP